MRIDSALTALCALSLFASPPVAVAATGDGSSYFAMGSAEAVEWMPFGPEAFHKATERGLPVFLNMGSVWSHNSRKMSQGAYSDPSVTEILNEKFIPVKVDLDQDPHLSRRFQAALRRIRGASGGIPLTGFLTDQGRMFVGGSYFAAENSKGEVAGLKTLALHVSRQYQADQHDYHNVGEEIINLLLQEEIGDAPGPIDHLTTEIVTALLGTFDAQYGGIGSKQKRPLPASIRLALDLATWDDESDQITIGKTMHNFAFRTLYRMADGAIRDVSGGGFHRATSDRRWLVPYFEKLLTTNSGLLEAYAIARFHGGESETSLGRVANEILSYILGTLSDKKRGGFYNAQMASIDGSPLGETYTWTTAQLAEVLDGPEEQMALAFWSVQERPGLFPGSPNANVLGTKIGFLPAARAADLEPGDAGAALAGAVAKLRAARAKRPAPAIDETMYSSGNGLAASALLVASLYLENDEAEEQALRTLDRFTGNAWNDQTGFARGLRDGKAFGIGLVEDQVYLADALLSAYEATGKEPYLQRAVMTIDLARQRFSRTAWPGLVDLPKGFDDSYSLLMVPVRPVYDGETPGVNAIYAMVEERLGRILAEPARQKQAQATVSAFAARKDAGAVVSTLARAASRLTKQAPLVVITDPSSSKARKLARRALTSKVAGVAIRYAENWRDLAQFLPGKEFASLREGKALAVVIVDGSFSGVAENVTDLGRLLEGEERSSKKREKTSSDEKPKERKKSEQSTRPSSPDDDI